MRCIFRRRTLVLSTTDDELRNDAEISMSRFQKLLLVLNLCGLLFCGLGGVKAAFADKVPDRPAAPALHPAPAPDAEGFVPDSRPPNMNVADASIPAAPLVATAYGFIWLAVLGFVLFTQYRVKKVEQEIAELAERIGGASSKARS
jgi:CcmD family protein